VAALAAAGCASEDGSRDDASAIVGLYAIDHDGASPTGDELDPYTRAFERVRAGCEGDADELASQIQNVANQATNGSGTAITNLDALQAVAGAVSDEREDCAGLLVGVEARLEGSALG
jgi:hypothetical protein